MTLDWMLLTMSKIISVASFVLSTMIVPSSISVMIRETLLAICFEFSDVACASLPISSATTAKPLPYSPARAASIAALRERRFILSEMSSMMVMNWSISLPPALMSSIFSVMFLSRSSVSVDVLVISLILPATDKASSIMSFWSFSSCSMS